MIHLFKKDDGGWIYSGRTRPSNMEGDDYVEGVLPEGETWDFNYVYTCVDGVATKGAEVVIEELEIDAHAGPRLEAYPQIGEQLDKLFHDIDGGKLDKTGSFYTALKAVKDAYPKAETN